jgi:VWFA-related protein
MVSMSGVDKIADMNTLLKRRGRYRAPGPSVLLVAGSILIFPHLFHSSDLGQVPPFKHDVRVINIEVPVRVFDGEVFVENLTLSDLEVFEDGIRQELQAVYFIKNSTLERKEEKSTFEPRTGRILFLIFNVFDYNTKLGEAIDYFVCNILKPEDSLVVVTPTKVYRLKKAYIRQSSKAAISAHLTGLIRHDVMIGNVEYRMLLEELTRMVTGGGVDSTGSLEPDLDLFGDGSWQEFLSYYRDLREQLDNIRSFATDNLIIFADSLKKIEGQKIVLFFYQREYVPMIDRKKYIGLFEDASDFLTEQNFHDLFDVYRRDSKIDSERIRRQFSDASISVHFLFITERPPHIGGFSDAAMEEHSEDIFSPFLEMAKATGGVAESSSNPGAMMKKSGAALENYYLLYYKPTNTANDGKFRNIRVEARNRNYRVLHRAGYFSK